ncbi:MAG: hypothetical protein QY321_02305 [Patescibacteria group bacterium]|nr:MAG: hypothetical protein QY321_02305 [Patescibacteria group bacterium]
MNDHIQRLIDLINKTGDKVIVFDKAEPEKSYVVCGLRDYEEMIKRSLKTESLTEDELIDKINSDIAKWKNGQVLQSLSKNEDEVRKDGNHSHLAKEEEKKEEKKAESLTPLMDWRPPKVNGQSNFSRPKDSKNPWSIPDSRRREADEVL